MYLPTSVRSWRSLQMIVQSNSSWRSVRTHRSACAFTWDDEGVVKAVDKVVVIDDPLYD